MNALKEDVKYLRLGALSCIICIWHYLFLGTRVNGIIYNIFDHIILKPLTQKRLYHMHSSLHIL